jgi:outer membrane protein assembly factor BamB
MPATNTIRTGRRGKVALAVAGTLQPFDTQTGKTLWSQKTPAGINAFPAIDGDTVLVGAAALGFSKNPQFQLVAYSID